MKELKRVKKVALIRYKELLRKVSTKRDLKIAVFGQGYVGLPLSLSFACAGLNVVGIDVLPQLVEKLDRGECGRSDNLSEKLRLALANKKYVATINSMNACEKADIGIICVPTPVRSNGGPDLSHVFQAIRAFLESFRRGKILIIESSLAPGSLDGKIIPLIEQGGIRVGRDIGLAYCPERLNPGDKKWHINNIPRVIAVSDEGTRRVVSKLYKHVVSAPLHFVSSFKTAEVVKSFENAFRFVNISLVNELAIFCERFGVDVYEVIDAASTKPFAFMPHYPSAGIGGHCLPKDSQYLYDCGKGIDVPLRILRSAIQVNERMPSHIVRLITKTMRELNLRKSKGYILVMGLSYKEDIEDLRDSPGLKVAKDLTDKGYRVIVYEPNIATTELESLGFKYLQNPSPKDMNRIIGICIIQYHSPVTDMIREVVEEGSVRFIINCKNVLDFKNLSLFIGSNAVKMIRLGSNKQ